MTLKWTETDRTTDGRFWLTGESVRGEGRWWNLSMTPDAGAHLLDGEDPQPCALSKRRMKQFAQRIADRMDATT